MATSLTYDEPMLMVFLVWLSLDSQKYIDVVSTNNKEES